jgi:hypothetical protein
MTMVLLTTASQVTSAPRGFQFDDASDVATCDAIRARLAPGGRIAMNVLVANDFDPIPDRIAARLQARPFLT